MTTLMTGQMPGSRGPVLDDDVDLVRDRALVERAQAGDRAAFDDLYLRYYRRLYRFCIRRLQDPHEAEDVAQEAFARAWRALPTFAGDRRFYPWLSVIASHLCTDVLRRRNRSTPVAEFHQSNVACTEDGGEERVMAAVDCDLVAQAFLRLSDRHQRILNLREGSGWSYQMIADHEGVGITAIETLLWRARQALKREFASLAGSEGRLAGFLGGLLSLAFLRRILTGLGHAARKLNAAGSSWTTAAALGSAAAVSVAAVAGGVALSESGPAQPAAVSHVSGHGTPDSGAPGAATPRARAGSAGGGSVEPPAHGNAGTGGGSPLGPVPGAVTAAPGLGGVVASAGSTLQAAGGLGAVTSPLGSTVGSLGTPVSNLGSTVGSTLNTVTSPLTTALGSTGIPIVSNLPTTGSSIAALPGDVSGVVSGVVGTLGSGLGALSGSTTSSSGTGGTTSNSTTSATSAAASTGCAVGTTLNDVTSTVGSLLGGSGATGSSTGCS